MSKDNVDPAFPTIGGSFPGMTLRDYFAAAALNALLLASEQDCEGTLTLPEIASDAYRMADYMLKERGE